MSDQPQQSAQPKSSIFVCKDCKTSQVKVQREKKVVDPNAQMIVKLSPASNDSKYTVKVGSKTVHFGLKGMSDFTQNKSEDRKQLYIGRHSKRESQYWDAKNPENLRTASFWSRFLLWETPTIQEAIKHIESKANIKIKYTANTIDKHQRKLAKLVKKSGEDSDF